MSNIRNIKYVAAAIIAGFFFLPSNCLCQIVIDTLNENSRMQILLNSKKDTSLFKKNMGAGLKIDSSESVFKGDTFKLFHYYQDGILIRTEKKSKAVTRHISNYDSNGKLHGEQIDFYPSGKLQSFSLYIHGGEYLYTGGAIPFSVDLYENGMIRGFGIHDTLTGLITNKEYYADGKIWNESISNVKTDNKIYETTYFKSGKISDYTVFNAGKQHRKVLWENGNPMEEYDFIDMLGYYVGELNWYYVNGNHRFQAFYKEGNTREEANYKIGTWSWWDEKGNLIKQEIYKNNELVETKEFLPKGKEKEK